MTRPSSAGCRAAILVCCLAWVAASIGGCAGPGGGRSGSDGADQPGRELHALLAPVIAPRDAHVGRYVEEVGQRLAAAAKALRDSKAWPADVPRPADWMLNGVGFALVEGSNANAFTAGGGHVYATAGLLRVCPTEDQFAAALAHAYAHVLCQHVAVVAGGPGVEAWRVALSYASFRYTPQQERQADVVALLVYARAGWSVDEYAGLLTTMGGTPVTAARLADVRPAVERLSATAGDWQQPPVADRKRYAANQLAASSVSWPTGKDPQATRVARLTVAAYPNCLLGTDTPAQVRAKAELPPPPPPSPTEDNPWGKGLPGAR